MTSYEDEIQMLVIGKDNPRTHLINVNTMTAMACGKTLHSVQEHKYEGYSTDINMVNCPLCVEYINEIIH